MRIKCCYQCEKRSEHCHSTCKEYNAEKELIEKEKENIRGQKNLEYSLDHMSISRGAKRRGK